jgi:UDP-glucose:(heptosyl)LPS alpha-1,3-glucosyltransferase
MDFKRKGLCYLLDALRLLGPELRRVHCLVVSGDDPRKYRLQALRDGTGPHVTFAPATEQIGEVYAAADIFAFPTLYDPFANVHLEALASGLPVITTASAGGAEVIRNGENGFVVPHAQDTKRMAECVLELLDSQARLRMSENAARSAGSFTIERNVREVASLYEEVFAEKGRC